MTTVINTTQTTTETATIYEDILIGPDGSIVTTSGDGINGASGVLGVTINVFGGIYASERGIFLNSDSGASSGNGSHYILVGSTGIVNAGNFGFSGIFLVGSANDVQNDGYISGKDDGVLFSNYQSNGFSRLTNSGVLTCASGSGVNFFGTDVSTQTGLLTNSGSITSLNIGAEFSFTDATVLNTGDITSISGYGISVTGGVSDITNIGTITGANGVFHDGGETFSLINRGAIASWDGPDGYSVYALSAANVLIENSGTLDGDVFTSNTADTVINSGQVFGSVELNDGDDFYDGTGGGTASEGVSGGSGNDTFYVDENSTQIYGGSDTDTVNARVDFALNSDVENLNLLGNADIDGHGNGGTNVLTGNSGDNVLNGFGSADTLYGEAGDDKVNGGNGIDNLFGGDGDDKLRGQKGADVLKADAGNDSISGGEGNDNLFGGDDNDILKGGMGRDKLYGGDDADVFLYTKAAHSKNDATADKIQDFELGLDSIDLCGVAAGTLTFIGGGAFSGTQGEVQVTGATNSTVLVDVDGDGTADMKISVIGVTGLSEGDFVL
ncbi:MAG: calcium-binding protein [Rhodobacteraceae bacterium]|nr:calcium-binding protein [Paracoccaceae bacterium]